MTDPSSIILKCGAAIAIFVCGLIGAQAARAVRGDTASPWLGLGNCFAGGVFVGAGLIHTLSDSAGLFSELYPNLDFPLWAVIAAAAIIALMWIDKSLGRRKQTSDVSGVTLFIVLSLHSILAGMALGLEAHPVQAAAILIAILAHKSSAAFALGLRSTGTQYWRRMATFALMTPGGVALGMLLLASSLQNNSGLFEAVFDAIAAGTFLYIALTEILAKELNATDRPHQSMTAALLGLTLMALLAIYT